jgi:hypothetical protein
MLPQVADTILWAIEVSSLAGPAEGAGTDPVPAVAAIVGSAGGCHDSVECVSGAGEVE